MSSDSGGELTTEQLDVINYPGNVFVVACPGSGKTRTLTYKIAQELEKLESHRKFVVAITYTNKAAEEIENRIRDLGVDTDQLWIGTIHAFCLEWILRPYRIYHPHLARGFSIVNSHDSEAIISRLCRSAQLTYYDCGYYFVGGSYELSCLDTRKHPAIHSVLSQYFDELNAGGKIDFEMILQYARDLIVGQSSIRKVLSNLFSFIAVDEYQDTKRIQYEILMSVVREGDGNVGTLVVGDPNQEIFTSLGGYAIAVSELSALIGQQIELKNLTRNFRSSKRVIEFFENFNIGGTLIEAAGLCREYPSLVTFNDEVSVEELPNELARLIEYNVSERGIEPRNICVLAPWWILLASMTRTLVARLPQYQFDGPGLVPFSRDQDNFWYKVARVALTEASPGLYIRRLRWARDIVDELVNYGVNPRKITARDLLRSSNAIDIDEEDGLVHLAMYFDRLMELLGIDYRALIELADQWDAFFESSQVRIDRLARDGAPFAADIEFFRRVFRERTGITVSTVHGVKGLEYDTVIAYGLLQDILPHFADPAPWESANKLLYVLASRARKNLHLIAERNRPHGRGRVYHATSPLQDLLFDYDVI